MKWTSYLVILVALSIFFSAFLFQTTARSASPCASCHGSYFQYLDILEGDSGNRIPTNVNVGQTVNVTVAIENLNNAPRYNTMSSVSVTLKSQNGHFSTNTPVINVGNLPVGRKTVTWQILGVSSGTDVLLITAQAANTHKSLSLSDSYNPSPSITVAPSANSTFPAITLTAPSGGEAWLIGSKHNITWTANGGTGTLNIGLEFSTLGSNGPWATIATGIPNSGIFTWTVPNASSTSSYIRATVFDSANPPRDASSVNSAPFTITTKLTPTISIMQPSPGVVWSGGSVQTITWNSNGKDIGNCQVTLAYSTDNFDESVQSIASRIPDSGSYNWTVPRINTASIEIRAIISDSSGQRSQDISESFAIDSAPPKVASVQPTNGLGNVSTSTSISITFSEAVVASTAEHAFSIYPNVSGITWNWNPQQTTMTASNLSLSSNTTFTATVGVGVLDLSDSGNANSAPFSWSFTTGSSAAVANQPPVIIFEVQEPQVIANQSVTFNASRTFDPTAHGKLLFSWNFGDGTPTVTDGNFIQAHSFFTDGNYNVKLTVSDGSAQSEQTMDILVRKAETTAMYASDTRDWHLVWAGLLISLAGAVGVYGSVFFQTQQEENQSSPPVSIPRSAPQLPLHAFSKISSTLPTLLLRSDKCVGCGFCARKCPVSAITIADKRPLHDPSKCRACMECANKCPRGSISIIAPTTSAGR